MAGQESQWPDGYLGTIVDRQQDKLLAKVQERLNDRSYQRGVHVGAKIGQGQYHWSPGFNPDSGLARQAQAVQDGNVIVTSRFAPTGDPVEVLAHLGKTSGMAAPETMALARKYGLDVGPARTQLQQFLPPWSN